MNPSSRILWLALTVCGLAAARPSMADSVSGLILDPDGRPVAGAELRLLGRTSGATRRSSSDDDGSYAFPELPPGDYLLEAEAAAATLTGSRPIVVDGDRTLDLMLTLSGTNVEVVVTASGTPLAVREVAKAVDVVDSRQLRMHDEDSIAEAVRHLPGVRVQQLRGPGGLTTIQTRGLRNHDTALLVDGMRFRDAASINGDAAAFLADMTPVGTERIELLRGSGSSIYGSHAVGGVLNLVSRRGQGSPHGELQVEGGGLGATRLVSSFSGASIRDRFTYAAAVSYLDVSRGIRGRSPYENAGIRSFLQYNVAPAISLSGGVWWTDASAALGENPTFTPEILANFPAQGPVRARALPLGELERFERGEPYDAGDATFIPDQIDPDNRQESSFLAGGATLTHQLSPSSSYRVAYQGVNTHRLFVDGPQGPNVFDSAVRSRDDGRTDTLQARTDHRLGERHLATLGYEFEREVYTNLSTEESPALALGETRIAQRSHAFFAQDQIRLFDGQLQVALSGRVEAFDLDTPFFSGPENPYETAVFESPDHAYTGDAALAYFLPGAETKLRAHAGNSYRSPSAFERFGASFFFGSFTYFGDPRLAPERSIAVDAGIDQALFGSKLQLSGTVFYTYLQETILFDTAIDPAADPFGRVFGGYRNGQGGIARGVELGGRWTPAAGTSIQASYTHTNSDSKTPTIGSDFFEALGVSDHTFTFTASHRFRERLDVALDLFAVSDNSQSLFGAGGRRLVFDGPFKADLVLRYLWPAAERRHVELYTKIENLLDREYYEDGFRAPGAWAVGGLRFMY